MLIFVIVLNILIAVVNFYLAFRIWQLRGVLRRVTQVLTRVERRIERIFAPAPPVIYKGQTGTQAIRQHYQQLRRQLRLIQQIGLLVNLGIRIWKRQSVPKKIGL